MTLPPSLALDQFLTWARQQSQSPEVGTHAFAQVFRKAAELCAAHPELRERVDAFVSENFPSAPPQGFARGSITAKRLAVTSLEEGSGVAAYRAEFLERFTEALLSFTVDRVNYLMNTPLCLSFEGALSKGPWIKIRESLDVSDAKMNALGSLIRELSTAYHSSSFSGALRSLVPALCYLAEGDAQSLAKFVSGAHPLVPPGPHAPDQVRKWTECVEKIQIRHDVLVQSSKFLKKLKSFHDNFDAVSGELEWFDLRGVLDRDLAGCLVRMRDRSRFSANLTFLPGEQRLLVSGASQHALWIGVELMFHASASMETMDPEERRFEVVMRTVTVKKSGATPPDVVLVRPESRSGDFVEIKFADNGPGAWDTAGQGLAHAFELVEALNGFIVLKALDVGKAAFVYLPRAG